MASKLPAVSHAQARLARIDLDDTRRCPVATVCAGCDTPSGKARLAVATADTPLGVMCLTLCRDCAQSRRVPTMAPRVAMKAVQAHCRHLRITIDDAVARRLMGGAR